MAYARRMPRRRTPAMPVRPAADPALPSGTDETQALSPLRRHLALALLAATLVYPLLESRFWSRSLWGAHALAFLPAAWWLVPVALATLFVPAIANGISARAE